MPLMIKTVTYRDADYGEILELQRSTFGKMVELRRQGLDVGDEVIMLVEHKPVYTLGRHAERANIINPDYLRLRGAQVYEIERGGDVTFHGPGQLVAYVLIDLQRHQLGVKDFVNCLEEAVIRTIGEYVVVGERIEGATGVWIGKGTPRERKICAIGIKCSRFITMHGLALNVDTDLEWFSAINPCGFTDKSVTSLKQELPEAPTWAQVAPRLSHHLQLLLK